VVAAELQDFVLKNTNQFRVFLRRALCRRRGGVRGSPRWPHHRWAQPGARLCPLVVSLPSGPPLALFRSSSFV
jgi:hypothetical protein